MSRASMAVSMSSTMRLASGSHCLGGRLDRHLACARSHGHWRSSAQHPRICEIWIIHHQNAILVILVVHLLEALALVFPFRKTLLPPLGHGNNALRMANWGLTWTHIVQPCIFWELEQSMHFLIPSHRWVALHVRHGENSLTSEATLIVGLGYEPH